jgi:hypothetical protein
MDDVAQQLAIRVREQLPAILQDLLQTGHDPLGQPLKLECSLSAEGHGGSSGKTRVPVAAVDIGLIHETISASSLGVRGDQRVDKANGVGRRKSASRYLDPDERLNSPSKRARLRDTENRADGAASSNVMASQRCRAPHRLAHTNGSLSNRALQPSTFEKFIQGVWDSIFSGIRMDPAEVIEQWQAIESSGMLCCPAS